MFFKYSQSINYEAKNLLDGPKAVSSLRPSPKLTKDLPEERFSELSLCAGRSVSIYASY